MIDQRWGQMYIPTKHACIVIKREEEKAGVTKQFFAWRTYSVCLTERAVCHQTLIRWKRIKRILDSHTIRNYFYMSKQHTGVVVIGNDGQLSVHGQRVRTQPESFWSYYSTYVGIIYKLFCRIFIVLLCCIILLVFF